MIFQGLFNLLDLYFQEIDLFYSNINKFCRERLNNLLNSEQKSVNDFNEISRKIISILTEELINLGFKREVIETKFLDPFLEINENEKDQITSTLEYCEKKIKPLVYEIFLEKIVDYLVNDNAATLILMLKSKGLIPIEFMMELRDFKKLLEKSEKIENLKKYIEIREKIIQKLTENKEKIETLEDLEDSSNKLQLLYLIYRIIDFFNLQTIFDFSRINEYLKNNIDEWLVTAPLITLKNPELYFCGLYLSNHLNVKVDKKRVKKFLLNLYEESVDEFEAPIIEATDRIYYYFKSTEIVKLWIPQDQVNKLVKVDPKFFESHYLKNLETSQLVVILKIYSHIKVSISEQEIKAILEELESRITPKGIKQHRDGVISSEATYYFLFNNYMRNTLDRLKDYNLLDTIVSRIYRNLEILDFSRDTNYDLVSELFYSVESLKLFNCIETKQMIILLAKFLFPQVVVEKISSSEGIARPTAKFRHLKVNRITGETIY